MGAGPCGEGAVPGRPALWGGPRLWEGSAEKAGAARGRLPGPGCAAGNRPQAAPASVSASSGAEAVTPRSAAEPVPAGTARPRPAGAKGGFGRDGP